MIASPWQSLSPVDPNREYRVLVTYLPLKRHWMIFKFLAYASDVRRQLNTAVELIGYSENRLLRRQGPGTVDSESCEGGFP